MQSPQVSTLLISGLSLVALCLGLTGCAGIQSAALEPTRTADISVEYFPSESMAHVTLRFGAAELRADGMGSRLVEGLVRYNVSRLRPDVSIRGSRVIVEQKATSVPVGARNEWDIHFGREQPLSLEVMAGAYDGHWDLGGVPLRELVVKQGASRSVFDFSQPNPETMERMHFQTGAADLELRNLANAGFRRMSFEGGASSYVLDFSGEMLRDGDVSIKAGLAELTILIPEDTAARVRVSQALTGISSDPGFRREGDTFYSPAWDGTVGAPKLTIDVALGLGSVNLKTAPAQERSL